MKEHKRPKDAACYSWPQKTPAISSPMIRKEGTGETGTRRGIGGERKSQSPHLIP